MGSAKDDHSNFAKVKAGLIQQRKLFEDPEFPAGPSAIQPGNKWNDYKWIRPKDICQNPKFIVEGATRFDLNQGDLNDCWFIAASACLATSHKTLFEGCVPPDQEFDSRYAGIFRFNFWKFGSWVEVIVDDILPCREVIKDGKKGYELVYAQNINEPNEFWVPLFEKAYAKLNGCYDNLNGGFSSDALVDFTGGISEYIDITPMRRLPGNLFTMLRDMMNMSSLIGTHINGATPTEMLNGLWTGHAYSITKVIELNGGSIRLLRIRNPWGKGEWTGRWSDKSKEFSALPENVRKEIEMVKSEDGEFWMSFDDWLANFERLTICHLSPDAVTAEICENQGIDMWEPDSYQSQWINGINAGGSSVGYSSSRSFWINPQFPITLKPPRGGKDEKCHVIISLLQKAPMNKCTLDIGFALCQVKESAPSRSFGECYESQDIASTKHEKCKPLREISTHYDLTPGNYVIIPYTAFAKAEGEFLLRIYTRVQKS